MIGSRSNPDYLLNPEYVHLETPPQEAVAEYYLIANFLSSVPASKEK